MNERSAWEEFFDGHAPQYMENVFTKNTMAEVDFLVRVLGLSPGEAVLDLGCGTGRHTVELARRGYRVTGVDLSAGMLEEARKAAKEAGVEVALIQADATRLALSASFDAAICLCEGSFGLLEKQSDAIDQPLAILRGLSGVLKPGGRCLLTVLNGYAIARRYSQADAEAGRFDPQSLCEISDCQEMSKRLLVERGFVPTELLLLFQVAGLKVVHLGGGTAGNWGLRPLELDEIEIMVLAERSKEGAAG